MIKVVQNRAGWWRRALRWVTLAAFCAGVYGVYRAYRWAEPSREAIRAAMNLPAAPLQTLALKDVVYESFANGSKIWSAHVDHIDLLRAPGNSLSGLQQATIVGIRSGHLYSAPSPKRGGQPAADLSNTTPPGPPVATFTADSGRYAANASDALPSDLRLLYSVYWQFQLLGNVKFKTRQGDRLAAPALTVLEMHNYRANRLERRIVCPQGADLASGNVAIHANSIRFDPASRQVECLGGVRGTLRGRAELKTVQAESAYWSLRDQTLRCPGIVTGEWKNGADFVARDVMLNMHTHTARGASLHLILHRSVLTGQNGAKRSAVGFPIP
jgi:hypothetical protein